MIYNAHRSRRGRSPTRQFNVNSDLDQISEPGSDDPDIYYPKGYKPELLEEWSVKTDLVVPVDQLPENLRNSMGDRWRNKVKNNEILKKQAEKD